MRALWSALFLIRRLRSEGGVVLLLITIVTVTGFLFAAAPPLFNFAADAGLRYGFTQAPTIQRHLQLQAVAHGENLGGTIAGLQQAGEGFAQQFPDQVGELVTSTSLLATMPRMAVRQPPRFTTFVSLRYQEPLDDLISLVDGRLPSDTGDNLPFSAFGFFGPGQPEPPPPPTELPVVEIAVSEVTAEAVGVAVGDSLVASVDPTDPLVRFQLTGTLEAELQVVGIFAITDEDADEWYDDRSLMLPALGGNIENPIYYATALVAGGAYPRLISSGLPMRFAWRYFVDPQRIDAGDVPGLAGDLRRLETVFSTTAGSAQLDGPPILRVGLRGIIDRFLAQRASAEAVLSLAIVGPFVLAAGTIGMLAILLVSRRRSATALARGRGASGPLLLGSQLLEALLLTGPATIVGFLAATALIPGRPTALSQVLAVGVGLSATVVLLLATWPVVRRPLDRIGRDDPPVLRTSPRRLVLEATAVGMAVFGIQLLRQRGLVIGGEGDALPSADPFLAAVPLLAGVAVGIVAMRLYPLPIRGLGWLAAQRAGLVAVLGLRTVGRHPAAANLPLLVLMLTAAFGAFSSVIMSTIDRGQVEASWLAVGADYRIEPVAGGTLTSTLDPRAATGVVASAPGYVDPTATFSSAPRVEGQIFLLAIDAAAYDAVLEGSPIASDWPNAFVAPAPSSRLGTPAAPIPAILSQRLPSASRPLGQGDTFEITVRGQVLTFAVVERRASFPGLSVGSFVIVPFDQLRIAAGGTAPLPPSIHFVRGPADARDALASLVRERSPDGLITSRHAIVAGLRDAPLVAAVGNGFRITLVVAAAYTAMAVIAALTLTAARRRQDLAYLRTLGLSAPQSVALTVVEHGPPVLLALAPGIGLGVALATLLAPSLGLSTFIGEEATVTTHVDWPTIAAVSAALVGVVALAIGISTWLARRAPAAQALRIGED